MGPVLMTLLFWFIVLGTMTAALVIMASWW